jgi:hypothetical protein
MSILYCAVIEKNNKLIVAESKNSESFNKRLQSLIKKMLVGNVGDMIEIENEKMVTYLRTKHTIFVCVSSGKYSTDRPKRFLKKFLEMMIAEFKSMDNIIPQNVTITKLILQERLEKKLNSLIEEFDSDLSKSTDTIIDMNKNLDDIKLNMNSNFKKLVSNENDMNELLLSSKKLNVTSSEFRTESRNLERETRCLKPWMIYVTSVFVISLIVYFIFSFYLCGSVSISCERK